MFKVDVEFSSANDSEGNPQWWTYKVTPQEHPSMDFAMVGADYSEFGAVDEVMTHITWLNEQYWFERQLTLF